MKHKDKTKNQNISELEKLQERIKELEILETEHKRIEDMLLESKEEFKAIFDGASNGIAVLDMTGKLIRVNKYMLDVGGYSEEELVGKRFYLLKMFPPKSIAKMISVFNKIKKGKDVPPYEMELFVKSGKKKTVEVRNSLLRKRGKAMGTIAVLTDITEQKLAVEKLKSSEERLKILFEFAPDAYYLNDLKGNFIDGNKAAEKLLDVKRDELIGKSFLKLKLLPLSQIPKAAALLVKNMRGHPTGPDEFILNRKDGNQVTVEISTFPVKIKGKTVVLGNARDITERKQAEEKIKASLKEKDVMLREIHHRVKNNMQIISSLLRLQSRNVKDETALDMFKVSQNRIRSMAFIHETLYQSEDLALIDFSDYIKRLITHLFSVYGTETKVPNLRLNVKDVYLDINRAIPCGLIINELVSNSLKHAFPDSRKGEITVEMRSDKKEKYTLIVKDTGIGMPKELDIQKTETLGMQLVNDLTEQIDGTIELNRIGGTTFSIMF